MSIGALFWFDVEDYVEPRSDAALKGLLEAFERRGVQATWKLVGEKARVLARRGRRDIIRLMQRQDVGYHTDFHSRHPVLAEYLESMDWDDGVAELLRRETPGYDDLVRLVGPASTFGQAGGSWAPQIYPAMRRWGIPLFMDEAGHIGLDGGPFRYCGVLNVNRLEASCTRMDFRAGEEGLGRGCRDFDAICERLEPRGGLVSIYYHPCEWATRGFWDGANFARGAHPPPQAWHSPPLRSAAEMAAGLALFERYLDHVASRPGVEVLTGRQVLDLLPDRAEGRRFSLEEIASLAEFPSGAITHRQLGDAALSPAEIFALVVGAVAELATDGGPPATLPIAAALGPTRRVPSSPPAGAALESRTLIEACVEAAAQLRHHGRMPNAGFVGAAPLAPADLLLTAGELLRQRLATGVVPGKAAVRSGRLELEEQVRGRWGWVVFPEGFAAPHIEELARLQTWTLKPAPLLD